MKLTTKGRYGLRLMLDLAMHEGSGPVLLKDIARRENLSEKYLWSLMTPLKAAGLVRSLRGAKGGYLLARPADEITLKDILKTLEGPISLVDCVSDKAYCERQDMCLCHEIWGDISVSFSNILEQYTLAGMLNYRRNHIPVYDNNLA